jgi:cob(I)alamin adenosyltransferase
MKKPIKTSSVTTKKGDTGQTSLCDQQRIEKSDPLLEAIGSLDEANAFIGLARARSDLPLVREILLELQNHIYILCAELSCPDPSRDRITEEHLRRIEQRAGEIERSVDLAPKFVIYGQSEVSAALDVARAVVRRAERRVAGLHRAKSMSLRPIWRQRQPC